MTVLKGSLKVLYDAGFFEASAENPATGGVVIAESLPHCAWQMRDAMNRTPRG